MARESKMSEVGNPGVVPRNVRNGLLFTLTGYSESPPADPVELLRYDPTLSLEDNMRSDNVPVTLNLSIGVQMALELVGFDPNGIDGIFGPGTRAALTAYQAARGLPLTPGAKGVDDVGQGTVDALASELDAAGFARFP